MTTYWQTHQVGGPYDTLAESELALAERAAMFPDLYDLMPVNLPGKVVLDYGCGPGHDTILMRQHDAFVFYTDASSMALDITARRLLLHGLTSRALMIKPQETCQVEHVHCAGVLHHTERPSQILQHLRRCLKPGGEARVMVYDGELSEHSQSDVPITHWWTYAEFLSLAGDAGFTAEYVGGYECSAPWRPNCIAACYRLT